MVTDMNDKLTSVVLKTVVAWTAVGLVIAAIVVTFGLFLSDPKRFQTLMFEHVRAVVGIPIAAISSFCVLLVFEVRAGQVEFEALGFIFRGGAGPAVIWVFSFLAFVAAIRLLW